jgi:hypothetical protein
MFMYVIRAGQTTPGKTDWKQYGTTTHGIYVDVDTREARFTGNVIYTASLAGTSHHWATTGGSCVYDATDTGFRVYVKYDGAVTPKTANGWKWHINWIGVQVTTVEG